MSEIAPSADTRKPDFDVPAPQSFDYSDLDPHLVPKLKAQAERIRGRIAKTTQDIIDIGRDLTAAKNNGALKHGQFLLWVKSEVGISPSTAQRWMRVAELGKSVSLTHLTLDAAYQLTAKDVTPEIISTVVTKAATGEIVPAAAVQEMISDIRERRLQAEAIERRQKRQRRMSKRQREKRDQAQREREAERQREKDEAVAAAAAFIERFGREGARFILQMLVTYRFDLECALEAALGDEAAS